MYRVHTDVDDFPAAEVRFDPAVEAEALAQRGRKPMDFTGCLMKGYVFVHPEVSQAIAKHWNECIILACIVCEHCKSASSKQ